MNIGNFIPCSGCGNVFEYAFHCTCPKCKLLTEISLQDFLTQVAISKQQQEEHNLDQDSDEDFFEDSFDPAGGRGLHSHI